jgi:hypothetical protein
LDEFVKEFRKPIEGSTISCKRERKYRSGKMSKEKERTT